MTHDDVRKLMGGYATGSLTDGERKALFEAALTDQDLFDELAGEQALKELLDAPGARQHLIAALAPRKSWWAKLVPVAPEMRRWLAAAAALALVGLVSFKLISSRLASPSSSSPGPVPQEVAEARIPAPPPAVPEPSRQLPRLAQAPGKSEVSQNKPKELADSTSNQVSGTRAKDTARTDAFVPEQNASPPVLSQAPQVEALKKAEPAKEADARRLEPAAPAIAPAAGAAGGAAGPAAARDAATRSLVASQVAPLVPTRFAFDYSIASDGRVRVVPASQGFLTVSATSASGTQVLMSNRQTAPDSAVEVMLPGDSTTATILFTVQSTQSAAIGTTGAIAVGGMIGGALDPLSGSKADFNPSRNSRLVAIVPIPPRR